MNRIIFFRVAAVGVLLSASNALSQPVPDAVPRVQVRFANPASIKVWFQSATGRFEKEARVETPGRINLRAGCGYRLKLTDIPNRPGLTLYPTLEMGQLNGDTAVLLAHQAISIELTDEDFDHVAEGEVITKVVFLNAREGRGVAISYRTEGDPLQEARRQGSVLAILRMGNIDLETPSPKP